MKRKAAGKARTVAHHHKHVKPAHAHHKGATGHAHKHHKAAKHHAAAHKHKGTVHRGLAPAADQVASCAAEALAASLRHLQLPGLSVRDADVLDLFRRAGGDPDTGAPILAVLEAASAGGLAGYRPAAFATIEPYRAIGECMRRWRPGLSAELDWSRERERSPGSIPGPDAISAGSSVAERSLSDFLILGLELPGPHAVLATPEGWWSWGELYCPWCEWPDVVVEEAWAVSWA